MHFCDNIFLNPNYGGDIKMKKLFGEWSMGWKKVIILSVVTAAFTAAMAIIPFFAETSFHDIAVNLEAWILFAMLIIMNCKTRKEASLKTFVFFLISQPLIYLIEALILPVGFAVFQYYKYWFIITVLTIPGAAIAYQVKEKGWLGTFSLSVATAFLGYMAATYFRTFRIHFPNHLLSMIFCIALAVMMIILFIDNFKQRLFASAAAVIAIVITLILTKPVLSYPMDLPEGDWTYVIEDDSIVQVEKNDSDSFTVLAGKAGSTLITFKNENGEIKEYYATISGGGIYMNEFD